MMTGEQWLVLLILAGLAGAGGQVARVVVGLKKLNDEAAAEEKALADVIDLSRMLVSVMIGFVAGMLGALATFDPEKPQITTEIILGFAAAGYLGADFIEGIMSRHLPKEDEKKKPPDGTTVTASTSTTAITTSTASAPAEGARAVIPTDAAGAQG